MHSNIFDDNFLNDIPVEPIQCSEIQDLHTPVRARIGGYVTPSAPAKLTESPFLSVDGIQDGELQFDGCRFISHEDHTEFRRKALPKKGDLLMGKAASTGKLARVKVDFEFSIWSPLALIRLSQAKANPAFFEQWLKSPIAQAQIDNLCTSNTQKNISMDDIPRLLVTIPPLPEQTAIAAFLDRETGKIDELVAEQRRLMELLKEKRHAVISHAVTQGLNPQAPMKPSGIEWLGNVPEHWSVQRLSTLCAFQPGKAHEPFIDDAGEFIVVNSRFVSTDGKSRKFCTQNLTPAKRNDILMVMSDLPNGRALAKAYFVADDIPYAVNQRVCILSPDKAHARFLFHLLNRNSLFLQYDDGMNQTHLSNDVFKKFPALFPPTSEQIAIADFLDQELAKFDILTAEAQRAIDLLQERRSALISAAVTGQIDVRAIASN